MLDSPPELPAAPAAPELWPVLLALTGELPSPAALLEGAETVRLVNEPGRALLGARSGNEAAALLAGLLKAQAGELAAAGPASFRLDLRHPEGRTLELALFALGPRAADAAWLALLRGPARDEATQESLRLASRATALRDLHAAVVHDLRGPLNGISLNLELLRTSLAARGQAADERESVESCFRQLRRLDHALNTLLSLLAPGPAAAQSFELKRLLKDLVLVVKARARRQHVVVEAIYPSHPVPIHGARDRLRDALLGVLSNALDALPRGGRLRITLAREDPRAAGGSAAGEAQGVCLTIEDDGPGIPSHLGRRALEAHVTDRPGRLGLGLGVASQVVDAHGGALELGRSDLGGARIEIRLPYAS